MVFSVLSGNHIPPSKGTLKEAMVGGAVSSCGLQTMAWPGPGNKSFVLLRGD